MRIFKWRVDIRYYIFAILTDRDRTWRRNLHCGANVNLLLKRKLVTGFAETELDCKAVEEHMFEYIQHIPQAVNPMGVRVENKTSNAGENQLSK